MECAWWCHQKPFARISIKVGGLSYDVEAAVANHLPVSVLLGRDVPDLGFSMRGKRSSLK